MKRDPLFGGLGGGPGVTKLKRELHHFSNPEHMNPEIPMRCIGTYVRMLSFSVAYYYIILLPVRQTLV